MLHDVVVYSTVKAAARPPHSKLLQFANPDVAVADRVVVVLQRQGKFFRTGYIGRALMVSGRTGGFDVILYEHAIVQNRESRWTQKFSGSIKTWAVKNDVVDLPLTRRARGVHKGRELTIDGSRLAIGVGFTLVGVEDLDFVETVKKDAAIAAILIFALRRIGLGEFDVKLAVAEGVASVKLAGFRHNFEVTVFYFPFRRIAVFVLPLGKILAVEEDDGVGGRSPGSFLRACGAWVDRDRDRAIPVVDFPFGIDLRLRECGGRDKKRQAG
jgi:hypothetical protein